MKKGMGFRLRKAPKAGRATVTPDTTELRREGLKSHRKAIYNFGSRKRLAGDLRTDAGHYSQKVVCRKERCVRHLEAF